MSVDNSKRALAIFEAALDLPPHERDGWVDRECSPDAELVAEVRSLLVAHEGAGEFLDHGLTAPRSRDASGEATEHTPLIGRQLGDFHIEREIGAGGMGVVYRARQISLNRSVALKVLPPHLRCSENARSRFQREIEAAARLHHRNIVAVYTTGEETGIEYYAMELIDGSALSQVIHELRQRPLPELASCLPVDPSQKCLDISTRAKADELTPTPYERVPARTDLSALVSAEGYFAAVVKLMEQVADGLAYAHQMQVIHRDIKPSNLLLSRDGELHISDFGLARLVEEPGLTRTGDFLGTPYYMAPEQITASAGAIGERTDVYALGATLYELLTLQKPFPGENREQVIAKILHKEPTSPRAINRQVPRDIETICLKALEREPSRRYDSAAAIAEDLRRVVERRPILARREGLLGHTTKWVARHRAWSASIAGICASVLLAGFFAYRSNVAEARWNDAEFGRVFETAQLAAIEGDLDRSKAAIAQAEQVGAPPAQLALLRGQLALGAGRHQDACDELERAVQEMPDSLAAHALLAKAYDVNQERDKRSLITARMAGLKPTTLQDYLLLGEAQSYTDIDKARATLDDAVQRYKNSVVARLTRGSMLIYFATESADTTDADLALDDLRIAGELLEPNARLLTSILEARIVAATAYELAGDSSRREQHLAQAAIAAAALKQFPDQFRSHQWRAVFFDYVGDDARAEASWRAMKDNSITFLVLTLYRLGKFPEALQLCDERRARFKTARITDFLRSFVLAANSDSPQKVLAAFEPQGTESMDATNAQRFGYTIYCIAGNLDRARQFSRQPRANAGQLASEEQLWGKIVAYSRGDLDEDTLLAALHDSRNFLCEAHYFIGLSHLAQGDRQTARKHFRASSEFKIPLCVEDHMSRALVAQLDREPNWPPWINAQ